MKRNSSNFYCLPESPSAAAANLEDLRLRKSNWPFLHDGNLPVIKATQHPQFVMAGRDTLILGSTVALVGDEDHRSARHHHAVASLQNGRQPPISENTRRVSFQNLEHASQEPVNLSTYSIINEQRQTKMLWPNKTFHQPETKSTGNISNSSLIQWAPKYNTILPKDVTATKEALHLQKIKNSTNMVASPSGSFACNSENNLSLGYVASTCRNCGFRVTPQSERLSLSGNSTVTCLCGNAATYNEILSKISGQTHLVKNHDGNYSKPGGNYVAIPVESTVNILGTGQSYFGVLPNPVGSIQSNPQNLSPGQYVPVHHIAPYLNICIENVVSLRNTSDVEATASLQGETRKDDAKNSGMSQQLESLIETGSSVEVSENVNAETRTETNQLQFDAPYALEDESVLVIDEDRTETDETEVTNYQRNSLPNASPSNNNFEWLEERTTTDNRSRTITYWGDQKKRKKRKKDSKSCRKCGSPLPTINQLLCTRCKKLLELQRRINKTFKELRAKGILPKKNLPPCSNTPQTSRQQAMADRDLILPRLEEGIKAEMKDQPSTSSKKYQQVGKILVGCQTKSMWKGMRLITFDDVDGVSDFRPPANPIRCMESSPGRSKMQYCDVEENKYQENLCEKQCSKGTRTSVNSPNCREEDPSGLRAEKNRRTQRRKIFSFIKRKMADCYPIRCVARRSDLQNVIAISLQYRCCLRSCVRNRRKTTFMNRLFSAFYIFYARSFSKKFSSKRLSEFLSKDARKNLKALRGNIVNFLKTLDLPEISSFDALLATKGNDRTVAGEKVTKQARLPSATSHDFLSNARKESARGLPETPENRELHSASLMTGPFGYAIHDSAVNVKDLFCINNIGFPFIYDKAAVKRFTGHQNNALVTQSSNAASLRKITAQPPHKKLPSQTITPHPNASGQLTTTARNDKNCQRPITSCNNTSLNKPFGRADSTVQNQPGVDYNANVQYSLGYANLVENDKSKLEEIPSETSQNDQDIIYLNSIVVGGSSRPKRFKHSSTEENNKKTNFSNPPTRYFTKAKTVRQQLHDERSRILNILPNENRAHNRQTRDILTNQNDARYSYLNDDSKVDLTTKKYYNSGEKDQSLKNNSAFIFRSWHTPTITPTNDGKSPNVTIHTTIEKNRESFWKENPAIAADYKMPAALPTSLAFAAQFAKMQSPTRTSQLQKESAQHPSDRKYTNAAGPLLSYNTIGTVSYEGKSGFESVKSVNSSAYNSEKEVPKFLTEYQLNKRYPQMDTYDIINRSRPNSYALNCNPASYRNEQSTVKTGSMNGSVTLSSNRVNDLSMAHWRAYDFSNARMKEFNHPLQNGSKFTSSMPGKTEAIKVVKSLQTQNSTPNDVASVTQEFLIARQNLSKNASSGDVLIPYSCNSLGDSRQKRDEIYRPYAPTREESRHLPKIPAGYESVLENYLSLPLRPLSPEKQNVNCLSKGLPIKSQPYLHKSHSENKGEYPPNKESHCIDTMKERFDYESSFSPRHNRVVKPKAIKHLPRHIVEYRYENSPPSRSPPKLIPLQPILDQKALYAIPPTKQDSAENSFHSRKFHSLERNAYGNFEPFNSNTPLKSPADGNNFAVPKCERPWAGSYNLICPSESRRIEGSNVQQDLTSKLPRSPVVALSPYQNYYLLPEIARRESELSAFRESPRAPESQTLPKYPLLCNGWSKAKLLSSEEASTSDRRIVHSSCHAAPLSSSHLATEARYTAVPQLLQNVSYSVYTSASSTGTRPMHFKTHENIAIPHEIPKTAKKHLFC